MVYLSRPLRIIVKKGGETVWKEMSFKKLPKDQQNATLNKMPIYFLVVPFCAATIGYYAMTQYQFNPKSWVAIQVGKVTDILFPPQRSTPNPMLAWKNKAMANYKEFIEMERAMRRPGEEVHVEEMTEEEMKKEAEKLWEQRRRDELNEDMNTKFEQYAKGMKM